MGERLQKPNCGLIQVLKMMVTICMMYCAIYEQNKIGNNFYFIINFYLSI